MAPLADVFDETDERGAVEGHILERASRGNLGFDRAGGAAEDGDQVARFKAAHFGRAVVETAHLHQIVAVVELPFQRESETGLAELHAAVGVVEQDAAQRQFEHRLAERPVTRIGAEYEGVVRVVH